MSAETVAFLIEISYRTVMAMIVANLVFGFAGIMTWVERKQSALMQNRIGANRAGLPIPSGPLTPLKPIVWFINRLGFMHMISDAIKMLTKEDFTPPGADKLLHFLAPLLSVALAILVFVAIPFGDRVTILGQTFDLRVVDIELGLLATLALLGMIVYGVMLAGLSSNNNFAMLGAMRAGAQMVSYEITLGLSLLPLILVIGHLDFQEIILWQSAHHWGILYSPIGFLLFMTAMIAESKRVPFDLPEGESEIIGYFVEYSGMKFGLFLFADFVESFLGAVLVTILFFGGWAIPFVEIPAAGEAVSLLYTLGTFAVFMGKVCFFTWLFMTVRWTLPRFRYDQLMDLCWKLMLPIALINLAVTAVVVWALAN